MTDPGPTDPPRDGLGRISGTLPPQPADPPTRAMAPAPPAAGARPGPLPEAELVAEPGDEGPDEETVANAAAIDAATEPAHHSGRPHAARRGANEADASSDRTAGDSARPRPDHSASATPARRPGADTAASSTGGLITARPGPSRASSAARSSAQPDASDSSTASAAPVLDAPAAAPPQSPSLPRLIDFDSAQLGAIAHLYRGEVYRSTIWRTRLDNTTNWSIVMMGIALTSTFSSPTASALPLLVVGLLLLVFLVFEARRYRYFNIWRARARWLEKNLYAPMLAGSTPAPDWREVLAEDYAHPAHHISFFRALGRRLRRNFIWILAIQSVAYWGKLAIHPFPAQDINDLIGRAAVGPLPGIWVLAAGLVYNGLWLGVALWSWRADLAKHGPDGGTGSMG